MTTSAIAPPVPLAPSGDAARTGTLVSMCLALVLVVASVSSVNLALTGISVALHASSTQLTWIADGYTVALAALVLPFGALGDRWGRRSLLLVGTAVFGAAALAAAAAPSAGALIVARVAMGAGAAMIMPGTLSTITAVFPPDRRAKAVSVWAGFAGSGAIVGLLTSGAVLEWFSWRATFLATAALAAVSFVASRALAPDTADPDEAVVDVPGFLLSALGIGALVYGIVEGAESGWLTSCAPLAFGVAGAALVAFVFRELRTPHPMLDVRLFTRRGFSTGTIALTVQFLCLFGFFFVGLQFLQLILGYSPLHSALCMLPLGLVVMPMSRVSPRLVERFGPRVVMTAGLTLLGAGLLVMARLDAAASYWHFCAGLVVFGAGMACTSTPATTTVVSALPDAKQGVGSAVNDLSRELGSALGIAILGSLFNAGYRESVFGATAGLPEGAAHAVRESPGAGLAVAARLGAAGEPLAGAVRTAFSGGLSSSLTAGAAIAFLAAAGTARWAPGRQSSGRRATSTHTSSNASVSG